MNSSSWTTITHAFCGTSLKASTLERSEFQARGGEELGLSRLLMLTQVHGDGIITYSEPSSWESLPEGDGIVAPITPETRGTALGVLTADCVPLLLHSPYAVAAIHAGWRGLATGVIENGIAALLSYGDGPIAIKIGPSAGASLYEVGAEVIEAIGERARFTPLGEKFLLNLQSSATACINAALSNTKAVVSVEKIEACTISTPTFHSYRRDGKKAGRNLSYIVIP